MPIRPLDGHVHWFLSADDRNKFLFCFNYYLFLIFFSSHFGSGFVCANCVFDCCKIVCFWDAKASMRCVSAQKNFYFSANRMEWMKNEEGKKRASAANVQTINVKPKDKHSDANLINAKCGAHRLCCSSFFFRSMFFLRELVARIRCARNFIIIRYEWNGYRFETHRCHFHSLHKSSCTNFSELLLAINRVWLNGAAICKCVKNENENKSNKNKQTSCVRFVRIALVEQRAKCLPMLMR